jgi:hypothetical protein
VDVVTKGSTTSLHSMKSGEGFVDTDTKMEKVISGITAAMKN